MKIFVLSLVALLLISTGIGFAREARVPGEKLAFDVLREIYSQNENALLSGYSLYTALSMTAEGANGETLEQILKALDAPAPAQITLDRASTANAAFIAADADVTEDFKAKLSDYSAEIFDMGAIDMSDVNKWAKEATDGLIDPLLTSPLASNTKLVLLNAITMKADWETPFKANKTTDGVFHAPNGDVTVKFMNQTLDMKYSEIGGMKLGELPYASEGLSAYFILPEDGKTEFALEKLSSTGYAIFDGLESNTVRLSVPKLDLTSSVSLPKALVNIGIKDAFTYAADLSGINGKKDLMIDDITQKVALKMDEKGTEAAAATSVAIVPKGIMPMPENEIVFKLDRPFILLIRESNSGQTLFCAYVANPAEK